MGRLEGKVAIVTGAAQGLGATYAKALAGEGARVTVTDIDDCAPVAEDIERQFQGAEILSLRTDVTKEADCQDMVAQTVARFGRLDILVSNAAISGQMTTGPFEEISVADWDKIMAVNVRGPFLCAKAAAPVMRAQRSGKIINIASGTLFKGVPGMLHYVSSKGAVLAMTRVLSRELGSDNICVNTLAPGLTLSESVLAHPTLGGDDMQSGVIHSRALKRPQMPEDLVGALLFLASPDSDFMTGQCMVVDGGSVLN